MIDAIFKPFKNAYPSRVLAIPFALLIALFFTFFYEYRIADVLLLVPGVFGLVLIYVFHHQIDLWWWKRHPPTLDMTMKKWLNDYVSFYRHLSYQQKVKFERRLGLFLHIKQFTLKSKKDLEVPEDLKMMVSTEFIMITLHLDDFLLIHFDQIILYQHPFASPQYQFLHTFETHLEDGVIILSLQQLVDGFFAKDQFFDLGLYAAVSVFILAFPRLDYPEAFHLNDDYFLSIYNLDVEQVKKTLGFDWINRLNLLIYCFFKYPDKMKEASSEFYKHLAQCFQWPIEDTQ